jgi:intergrase/recombinase
MDVVDMFKDLENDSQKRHLVNGLRNLFNFYEAQGLAEKPWLDLLRRNLPKTSIGVDLRIPSEEEVIESLKRMANMDKGKRFLAVYNLLLDSGLRLTEAVRFFNALKLGEVKLERHDGFYIAPLGYFRNTKLAYYGFITEFTLKIIKEADDKPLTYNGTAGKAKKQFKAVNGKYIRKFVFDQMTSEQLNIPESVADFIQGRTPKTVGARHYMKLKRKAIQFYPRYAEYITRLRRKALN